MHTRILCVGDIHIKPGNIHLVDLLESQILGYISEHDINLVVLLGDVLDTFERLHTQAVNRAYQLIDRLRASGPEVYVLVGNHDYINNQQYQTDQHWMNALKQWDKVRIVDKLISSEDGLLCFIPYVPVGRFCEVFETAVTTPILIFAHQEFRGCKMGAITSVDGDIWDRSNPLIISGHIHESQKPQENIWYPGAAIHNSFGDTKAPHLLKIIISDAVVEKTCELPIHLPRKRTLYIRDGEITTAKLEEIVKLLQHKDLDQLRLVYQSTFEQFKNFCKSCTYSELMEHSKLRIVHKSFATSTAVETPTTHDFEELLHARILQKRNELLYSLYALVVSNTEIDPKNILII